MATYAMSGSAFVIDLNGFPALPEIMIYAV